MKAVKWLSRQAIETIHQEQLGGARRPARTQGRERPGSGTCPASSQTRLWRRRPLLLGASYLYGFARNHPFSDDNKRTAYLAAFTFLLINGYLIEASQADVIEFVLAVAAGEIYEEGATRFLRDHTVPYP
ncbi:type II toxin-antitoxin system death-on-curing family toxin [Neorhizobium sp. S3-V5DH]|uniref:type II toxin-antitoxin system death-on-curing family toxin n=1 Tax=Neorhizobium sp. S3-V5DH TaxID=2485166 RepID=UPI001FDF1CB9|nr:type II toxin-antitoxin system death-on-curing family toxin [Neorhizobium sp. S3-V5DH]